MANQKLKVLVIRFSSFGDLILCLPAVEKILSLDIEVHVLTKEKFREIFTLINHKNLVIHTIAEKEGFSGLWKVISELRKCSIHYILDFHNNLRSRIVSLFLNKIVFRVSKHRLREWFLWIGRSFANGILKKQSYYRYEDYISLFSSVTSEKNSTRHDDVLEKSKTIAICTESAWIYKEWSIENFILLSRRLKEQGYKVIWLGLKKEIQVDSDACDEDLRGKLEFQNLVSVLKSAALLICNDAGMLHLSEYLGVPVVGIYGPTSPSLGFAPRLQKSAVVEKTLWCRPCSKNGGFCHRIGDQKQKCLKIISVEDVLSTSIRLMNC